jgi:hypothetical protein
MPKKDPAHLTSIKIKIPWVGEAEWTENPKERNAAWSLYIELVTRIATEPLPSGEGHLREALNSLHEIFGTTREILKEGGPDIGASANSVGGIAIRVLNRGIRPFLAHWHPALSDWETLKDSRVSSREHERSWTEAEHLRSELNTLRVELALYADGLATIAGVACQ